MDGKIDEQRSISATMSATVVDRPGYDRERPIEYAFVTPSEEDMLRVQTLSGWRRSKERATRSRWNSDG